MRRAALALLIALTACSAPTGVEREACGAAWRARDAEIVEPGGSGERAVPIDCMLPLLRRRVRIGFTMPGGPDCYRLSRIQVAESADAVSIALFVTRNDDPNAGACSDQERQVRTELDLQADVGSRVLLDGSALE